MKYFSYNEFFRSHTAESDGINNYPSQEEIVRVTTNIEKLVNNVLDPLREHIGDKIFITSGYRTKELNKRILGAKKSQHLEGKAADITMLSYEKNMLLCYVILKGVLDYDLDFDQIILERVDGNHYHWGWIHISYNGDLNRFQVLERFNRTSIERQNHQYNEIDRNRIKNIVLSLEELNIVRKWKNQIYQY